MDIFSRTIIVKLQLDQIMVINFIMGYIYIYLCIYNYISIYIYANISYQGEPAHTHNSYVSYGVTHPNFVHVLPGPFSSRIAQGAVGMTHDRRNWVM